MAIKVFFLNSLVGKIISLFNDKKENKVITFFFQEQNMNVKKLSQRHNPYKAATRFVPVEVKRSIFFKILNAHQASQTRASGCHVFV